MIAPAPRGHDLGHLQRDCGTRRRDILDYLAVRERSVGDTSSR
jgi:hypothetical protein